MGRVLEAGEREKSSGVAGAAGLAAKELGRARVLVWEARRGES